MRQRLRSGEWAAGDRLKPLAELAAEFDVAIVTLRQAVAILEEEGMLRRRQGRGTFVTDNPIHSETFSVGLDWPQILDMITKTTPKLLAKAEGAELPPSKPEGCIEAPSYTFLRRVNSLKGRKCLVTNAYIDSRIYGLAPKRFETETIIPVMESLPGVRISGCRQVLTIGQADMETATLLQLPVNAPMGDIKRLLTDSDGVLIYYNEVSYRGDMVRFEIDLDLDVARGEIRPQSTEEPRRCRMGSVPKGLGRGRRRRPRLSKEDGPRKTGPATTPVEPAGNLIWEELP